MIIYLAGYGLIIDAEENVYKCPPSYKAKYNDKYFEEREQLKKTQN